jgi:hypothetical protein
MRFYQIDIGKSPQGSPAYTFKTMGQNGDVNPGALQIEIDAGVSYNATPSGQFGPGFVRLWGCPLKPTAGFPGVNQASDLNGASIKVSAGMSKGLPLTINEVNQQGIVLQGSIWQAFGNWIGTDMTIDLNVYVGADTPEEKGGSTQPKDVNINWTWQQGQPLGPSIQQALSTAYPNWGCTPAVSSNLVAPQDDHGVYTSFNEFARMIHQRSVSLLANQKNYQGVRMTFSLNQQNIIVTDSTDTTKKAKAIAFPDLIGQPTWIGFNQLQFTTVMRADLDLDDLVTFPSPMQVTKTSAEQAQQPADQLSFGGGAAKFQIIQIRHVGNFRQADARSWVSVFNAFPTNPPQAAAAPGASS